MPTHCFLGLLDMLLPQIDDTHILVTGNASADTDEMTHSLEELRANTNSKFLRELKVRT